MQTFLSCECESRKWILPKIRRSASSILWKPAEKNDYAPNHLWWAPEKRRFENFDFWWEASAWCGLVHKRNLCSWPFASDFRTWIYAVKWIERQERPKIYASCWRVSIYVGFPKCGFQKNWSWWRIDLELIWSKS